MRPIWEGSLSFGLILIPVKLYKATVERKPIFHFVGKDDLCPVKYVKVCKFTGEEIPFDKIARTYEYRKGEQILLDDKDFKKAYKKRSENIEILEFTGLNEIDLKLFEQPYYLEPAKGAAKVYSLLREALKKTGKAGIAKFVLHNLEHLGVLMVDEDILILNQIRFSTEIRTHENIQIPLPENMNEKELDTAIMLIDQLTMPFNSNDFLDTYSEEIKKAIEEKAKTGKFSVKPDEPTPKPGKVLDLMEKLKLSLEEAKKKKNVS
ncbi:MAG: Ku protein [Actinomycetota bacterium]|nr:Ku protein [Actinomycetota bacterium]